MTAESKELNSFPRVLVSFLCQLCSLLLVFGGPKASFMHLKQAGGFIDCVIERTAQCLSEA